MLRITILCNHGMAHGAIKMLHDAKLLVGLCITEDVSLDNKVTESFAQENGISLSKCGRKNYRQYISEWLEALEVDIVYVMNFPYILTPEHLSIPALGVVNFHCGILPNYRGPNPIFWQLLEGRRTAGVSVHMMDVAIDEGPLILESRIEIEQGETFALHLDKLLLSMCDAAKEMTLCFVDFVKNGKAIPLTIQAPENACYQPKPTLDHVLIDWDVHTNRDICGRVCAANGLFEGAVTSYRGERVFIIEVTSLDQPKWHLDRSEAGTVLQVNHDDGIIVGCCEQGTLAVRIVKFRNATYSAQRFVSLFNLEVGDKFV